MRMVGKPLLPWQEQICDVAFALRADGKWAAYEVAIWVARQNGKGVVTEAQELFGAYMLREKKIIHSAHLFDTSREAFLRLVEIIEGSDWLRARTKKPIVARGSEAIPLTRAAGGGEIKFKARTEHGARGFSGDRIILDEAYALTVGHFKAMSPTLATIPNAQITYTSSPPDEKTGPMPEDAMAPSIRKRGQDGGDPRLASFEWSPREGSKPGDIDEWYACNPSLGYLIDEEYLESQFRIFDAAGKADGFTTEHLGGWPSDIGKKWQVISKDDWLDLLDEASTAKDPLVFAIDTTPERSFSSIAAVGARPDGDLHGEVVDHSEGTSWVTARAVELNARWKPARWVVDAGGAAGFLIPALTAAGLVVESMTSRQVGQAYGMFRSASSSEERGEVQESAPALTGEPAEALTEALVVPKLKVRLGRHGGALAAAVEGAATRRVGDGTTWDRKSTSTVISPLVALTNAVFGFVTREPDPGPREPLVAWG